MPPTHFPAARNKRLCILLPTHWAATLGGAEYQVKLLLDALLAEKSFDITYLARAVNPEFTPSGYSIRRIGTSRGNRYLLDAAGILRALRQIKPDVIYARVGCAYVGVAAYYCQHNPCRLVWHLAGRDDVVKTDFAPADYLKFKFFDKLILQYGLRRADEIVAQTADQDTLIQQNYQRRTTLLVRNFHPLPEAPPDKNGPLQVLWIGNLKTIKQPQLFLDLAEQLADLNARFVMVGGNQLSERQDRLMQQRLTTLQNLQYLGSRSQDEVNTLLAGAHLLVNTSVSEGFSNTFIQAWMRQVPVVSLNADPDGLLQSRNLGIFARGDVDVLRDKVRLLLDDTEKRLDLSRRAEQYARENHAQAEALKLVALLRKTADAATADTN